MKRATLFMCLLGCTPTATRRIDLTPAQPPPPDPSFSLTLAGGTLEVLPGATALVNVKATRIGEVGAITLSLVAAPAGVAASGLIAEEQTTTDLAVMVPDSVPPGNYDIRVHGVASALAFEVSLALVVVDIGDYILSVSQPMPAIVRGFSADVTVSIQRGATLDGPVSLSLDGAPANVTTSFDPSATATATSTLTLYVAAAAATGTYPLTVKGAHALAGERTASVTLRVDPPPEICTNAVDDDGDGNVDCADSECGAFACVPEAPAGWLGPTSFAEGGPTSTPSCGGATTQESLVAYDGLVPEPAQCSACSCTPPLGYICAIDGGTAYQGAGCPSSCNSSTCGGRDFSNAMFNCRDSAYVGTIASNQLRKTYVPVLGVGTACTNGGATVTKPPPVWTTVARLCSLPSLQAPAGCSAAATVCRPLPSAPFSNKLCVYKTGDNTCPATTYTAKNLYYTGVNDARGCSTCSCGSLQGITCTGTYRGYSDPGCSSLVFETDIDSTADKCVNNSARYITFIPGPLSGSPTCGPVSGGTPNGTITEGAVVTVCCTP